jgi:hypothetical protein
MKVIKFIPAILLFVSLGSVAQYPIPGDGSIPMPPGCQAAFYLANYCVAAGIVPMNFDVNTVNEANREIARSAEQNYGSLGYQCLFSNLNRQSCARYMERSAKDSNCANYWERFSGAEGQTPLGRMQLKKLSAMCGGVISQ